MTLTYDAFGRMAEQNRSGVYTQFVYSPTGFKMQIMSGQSATKLLVPLPGGGEVVYNASGMFYYHSDHLGSFRFGSSYTNRNMYFDLAYAPFGETYATSGSTDISFTGQRQDTVSGLCDFPAREYSIQGRWPSPDPAGLAAVDPTNPQSWNRYAYVMNNPLANVDPLGMNDCAHTSGDCGTIVLDGTPIDVSGWFGRGLWTFFESSGAVAQCPFNDCGPYTGSNGYLYQVTLTTEGFSYISPLNGEQFDDGSELGLPSLIENPLFPSSSDGGQGGGTGSGLTGCPTKILNAVNGRFGTNFTSANVGTGPNAPFQWPNKPGGTVNIDIFVPAPMQPDGLSPGRYPVNWWTYIVGFGSTLHIPGGPGGLDSPQTLTFSNSQFTAHLDSALPYNPMGAALHLFHDVLGIGGHSPCP